MNFKWNLQFSCYEVIEGRMHLCAHLHFLFQEDIINMLSIEDLLSKRDEFPAREKVGTSAARNIDKGGHFYHVITQSWSNETIFYNDVAAYRQKLLCNLCIKHNVVIVFAVTMPNHTHEVFIAPSWEILSEVFKTLNTNVSKYIRRNYAGKARNGRRILNDCPAYIRITDVMHLFYLGKYIYENPQYLKKDDKPIPYTCFWMFEKGYLKEPYREDVYLKLFELTYQELYQMYSSMTPQEVRDYAKEHFRNMPPLP